MLAQKLATASRPSYSNGIGGIDMKTSSVRSSTNASTSADSHALTNFATMSSSERELGPGAATKPAAGGHRRCRLERHRLCELPAGARADRGGPGRRVSARDL